MKIRKFESSLDYKEVESWWWKYKFPALPEEHLPQDGLIVELDGIKLAAGWMYIPATGKMAMLEWIVGNPEVEKEARSEALTLLINTSLKYLKRLGFKHVFTSTSNKSLIKKYGTCGFHITDENSTNLLAVLE